MKDEVFWRDVLSNVLSGLVVALIVATGAALLGIIEPGAFWFFVVVLVFALVVPMGVFLLVSLSLTKWWLPEKHKMKRTNQATISLFIVSLALIASITASRLGFFASDFFFPTGPQF